MSTSPQPPTPSLLRRLLAPITILALSLVALEAIIRPTLPCSDDAAFHLLRLTQLDHLLRQGVLFSRWAPDMAQGYGFPFFNFYAPLSYYLAEAVSLLVGNLHLGMRLTFALSVYLAGLAAYRLARDHFSPLAAIVTAVSYMYAPYFAYDILFRGNLAESVAWPLLPLALWTMGRLARTRQKRWFIATTLSYAAVLLTHNVFALIFSPLLGLYGLLEIRDWRLEIGDWKTNQQSTNPFTIHNSQFTIHNYPPFILITLSLLLGLALTTFFWLPALIERNIVHSDRLLIPPVFVYWGNFVTLAEVFTPPQTVYSNLINPSPARTLGLVSLILALPAILLGWKVFRNGRKRQTIFFTTATAIYIFLMTAVSTPIWANLPLIEFVQFPWRLLGPAALCLAILVGASIDVLTQHSALSTHHSPPTTQRPHSQFTIHNSQFIIPALYITILILANLYYLDARYCPGLENPTIAAMQQFERDTLTIGTTAKGEYLPLTVEYMPAEPATEPFAPLPETAVLLSSNRTPKQLNATLSASQPFTLTANLFDYPGWQATLNGTPVPITPADGTGLITLPIPTGDHTLTIQFRETPLRIFANLISIISLIILIVIAFSRQHSALSTQKPNNQQSTTNSQQSTPPFTIHNSQFTIHNFLSLSTLGLTLFILTVYILPKVNTPLQTTALPTTTQTAVYNNTLTLLDTQIASRTLQANDSLLISSRWQAPQPVNGNYRATIRLIDPDGLLWSPKTAVSPRWYRQPTPTNSWQPQQFADSQLLIEPIPGTPPGTYTIQLLLFDEETLAPVPLSDGQTSYNLGTVQVTRPNKPAELDPQYPLNQSWQNVTLIGSSLDREVAAPGDPFLLSLYWQVDNPPTEDAFMRLSLMDGTDTAVFTQDLPPVPNFPPTQWQAGDNWLGQHPFRLPVTLASGEYQWQLDWCTQENECQPDTARPEPVETAVLGTLTINAPTHTFTPPAIDIATNAQFDNLATLLGLAPQPPSSPAPQHLTLIWQANTQTETSYRVFIHLLNQNGEIVAQSDGEPANWTRPTTSWLSDEIIIDDHSLSTENLPAGTYQLNIGLYDPATGDRLTLPNGDTAVTIPNIQIP